jgi:hypothetical protein
LSNLSCPEKLIQELKRRDKLRIYQVQELHRQAITLLSKRMEELRISMLQWLLKKSIQLNMSFNKFREHIHLIESKIKMLITQVIQEETQ